MSTKKYHFLNGKQAITKEFESDAEAKAAAEKDETIQRVQDASTSHKYIYEKVAKAAAALIMAVMIMAGLTAQAATTVGVVPSGALAVVQSSATTNYSQAYLATNWNGSFNSWPTTLVGPATGTAGNLSYTNPTTFYIPNNTKAVIFHMIGQLNVANSTTATNIIFHLGRSGLTPTQVAYSNTNAPGIGLVTNSQVEWFATITNTAPASLAANTWFSSTASFNAPAGFVSGGSAALSGLTLNGYNVGYVGWIDVPQGITLTNYGVYWDYAY